MAFDPARTSALMRRTTIAAAVLLIFIKNGLAINLRAETIEAFNTFITSVEMRLTPCFRGKGFLWSDEFPSLRQKLLTGVVIAEPVQRNGIVAIRGGLVQDWRGAVFIPRANLGDVLSVVQDYEHHAEFYRPDVENARIESRKGDDLWSLCES
jgi:hypothetical protein